MNIDIPSIASWKTTALGAASLFLAAMQTYHDPTWSIALHDPQVQTTVALGILGLLAKDSNVTGGTKGTPSTPAALRAANQAPAVGSDAPKPS
jgi:hypothetical protein